MFKGIFPGTKRVFGTLKVWKAGGRTKHCDAPIINWRFAHLFVRMRPLDADMAKLVDALDLGSSVVRRGGSSPSIRTIKAAKLIVACSINIYNQRYEALIKFYDVEMALF